MVARGGGNTREERRRERSRNGGKVERGTVNGERWRKRQWRNGEKRED